MADSTGAGARILVVDDDPAIGGLIAAILGKDGYTVLVAKSGTEGLAMATAEHPHLILMDITMPDMDGYEVTRLLKATPAMKDIPVIFLTGRSASEDGGRAFCSGGLTFMRKPFTAQQLRDLVSLAVQSLGV